MAGVRLGMDLSRNTGLFHCNVISDFLPGKAKVPTLVSLTGIFR